jgi:hypothetical protein
MFRTFADVQTADMLNLPCPVVAGGKPQIAAAPASEPLKAFIKTLTERAERLRTARIDPSIDNMLKITGDGRKAALDMRLIEPFGEPESDTKLSLAIDRIRNVWEQTRDARSTQLVFCDLSTPNPDRFNVYDEVRTRLMRYFRRSMGLFGGTRRTRKQGRRGNRVEVRMLVKTSHSF